MVRSLATTLMVTPLVVLAACSSSAPPGGSAEADAGASSSALTWHRDVRPVVEQRCATCHVEGGFAPFALGSFADAHAHRASIAAAVDARTMPPWPPSDACNHYEHDRSLTDAEREVIVAWARGDSAEGDPTTYAAPSLAAVETMRIDRTLGMTEAYTPVQSPDEYRCFVMDWNETTSKFVTGLRVKPGYAPIVHHAIAFLAAPSDAAAVVKLDAADPGPGYKCFGGIGVGGVNAGWLGAWVPGSTTSLMPAGTGIEVAPGSKVVLQMHYNTASTAARPDLSSVELQVDDTVATRAAVVKFANPSWVTQKTMNIKAGDADSVQSFAFGVSPYMSRITGGVLADGAPFTIRSAALHMHSRGVKGTLSVVHPDGTRDCALEIDDWSFHWQDSYRLQAPIVVQPGDELSLECHFDNSGHRQPMVDGKPVTVTDVNWGETTEDEMCLGVMYATP
jgi:hypothetical protein